MNVNATGRHGIGSPCKPPSRVQRVRSAIRDDGAAAAGTGMCRLRRSVRAVGRDEGTREAGGLPGGRLLVLFAKESGSFKSHSPQPEGRAKPHRGQGPRVLHGEAMPSKRWIAFRQRNDISTPHPNPLPQRERGSDRRMPRLKRCRGKSHKQKPQPNGCGFFIGSTGWRQQRHRP